MQVVIASQKIEEAQAFAVEISRHFLPNKVIAFTSSRDDELSGRIPLIKEKAVIQGKPTGISVKITLAKHLLPIWTI
jgi:hypothetical protein